MAVVTVPFVLPTVVVALAFLAVLPAELERGWFAILIAHVFFNVAVVVRVVGAFWAGLDPRALRSRCDARREPGSQPSRGDAPPPRSGTGVRGLDRVPVLVHVVRDRPHPRRPPVLDPRDGDLQPGRADVRPASGGSPRARAARLRRARSLGGHTTGAEAGARRAADIRARGVAPAPDTQGEGTRRGQSRIAGDLPRCPARRAGRAFASQWRRPQPGGVSCARPADRRAARDALGGRAELRRLCRGRSPHRARRGRVGGVCHRRLARRMDPGCSTDPSCSHSARPP